MNNNDFKFRLLFSIFAFEILSNSSVRHTALPATKGRNTDRIRNFTDPPTDSQIVKQVESIIAYTLMYHYIVSNVLRKDRDLEVSKYFRCSTGDEWRFTRNYNYIRPEVPETRYPVGRAKRTNARKKIFNNILAPPFFSSFLSSMGTRKL